MKILDIRRENMPCWYQLSLDGKSIVLGVHEDFVRNRGNISDEAPIIWGMKAEHGFNGFEGSFGRENFGFDKAFINRGLNKSFFEMEARLPVLRKKSNESCGFCNGIGKDFYDDVCEFCDGEGNHYFYDFEKAFAISATFTVFFTFSFNLEIQTSSNLKQLMTVDTRTRRDIHGGSICGNFSALLVNWLRTIKDTQNFLTLIRKTTVGAYTEMDGRKPGIFDSNNFRMALENGRLFMDCPGDACGINPNEEWWDEKDNKGYGFSCHNVDGPMQQLTLLAGLAVLHDEARKAGV